jgi:uncharacterized protein YqjF (DUF2071 family)
MAAIAHPEPRFLTAEWRHLAMLNYEIDPALLAARVPAGCEIDAWSGRTFVSVVGFQFQHTRVLGLPIPFHRNFEEVNLRFYVRRKREDGWRRGVVFVRELVPRRAIALVARALYGENYTALPMRHSVDIAPTGGSVAYQWRRLGRWEGLSVELAGEPALAAEDSEEAFITEHYWGYSRQRDGLAVEYQVEHPRWRVWRADRSALHCDVGSLYGREFAEALSDPPTTAFVAEGSPVLVRRGRPLSA